MAKSVFEKDSSCSYAIEKLEDIKIEDRNHRGRKRMALILAQTYVGLNLVAMEWEVEQIAERD